MAVTFFVKLAFFLVKCLFPWNQCFFVNFNACTFIYEGFRVLSAAFVWILLFAVTLEHLTVLSLDLVFIYECSQYSLFRNFKCTIRQISYFALAWHLEIMSVWPVNFPWISETPIVNIPWNWAYFQKHPVKSRIFLRELGWSLVIKHAVCIVVCLNWCIQQHRERDAAGGS